MTECIHPGVLVRARLPRFARGRHRRGMTLVEVLAVVVILGLVASTLAVGFSGAFGKGKHELAKTQIALIVGKIESYRIQFDAWPSPEVGLQALSDGHASPSDGHYLPQDKLFDPWGKEYVLIIPGPDGHPYEIMTFGADGTPGGEGADADVSSVNLQSRGSR